MKSSALVSDGVHRKSLSVTRALGKQGIQVSVVSDEFFAPSFWSKYCKKRFHLDLLANKDNLNLDFLKLIRGDNSNVVFFPMEDATIKWLSDNRSCLSVYLNFLIPSSESLMTSFSKFQTMKLAESIGVDVPRSVHFATAKELKLKIAEDTQRYLSNNFLIKPNIGHGSSGIIYLQDFNDDSWGKFDLEKHFDQYGSQLLQHRLSADGRSVGVSLLFDSHSQLVASFVHERISSFPVSGGPSTNRVGIRDDNLLEDSVKLLQKLNWQGVAMVEWKFDSTTGKPFLLEINPRFWGSLELAIRSGVNFPVLYFDLCCNKSVGVVNDYEMGKKVRWVFPGDILRYLSTSKVDREPLFKFIVSLLKDSEEWDSRDVSGSIASVLAPFFMLFKRKYWKFLKR
jgi:predicted ATP-grasp superfamily ATP-dependent carboligase